MVKFKLMLDFCERHGDDDAIQESAEAGASQYLTLAYLVHTELGALVVESNGHGSHDGFCEHPECSGEGYQFVSRFRVEGNASSEEAQDAR